MTEELPCKQQTNCSVLSGYVDGTSCNLFVARKLLCYETTMGFDDDIPVTAHLDCSYNFFDAFKFFLQPS
jgi:hypothetical protein